MIRHSDLLSELRRSARISGRDGLLRMALSDWAVIFITWIVIGIFWAVVQKHVALQMLSILIIAGRLHALGVVLHDAIHSRQASRDANSFFKLLCCYPIATTLEAMRFHHLRHHKLYGTDQDPYLKKRDLKSSSTRGIFKALGITTLKGVWLIPVWILRPLVAQFAIRLKRVRKFYQRALLQDRTPNPSPMDSAQEVDECLKAEKAQLLFWLGLALTAAIVHRFGGFSLEPLLTYYLIPLWLGGFLNVWRVLAEHDHSYRRQASSTQDLNEVWKTTNTLILPGLAWLLAPRNIGFHQVHHLYPAVALQNLPIIHRQLLGRTRFANDDSRIVDDAVSGVPVTEGPN